MDERLSRIEARLRELDQRVRALEHNAPLGFVAVVDEPAPALPLLRRDLAADFLTLTGRSLVALGGAYLLRALTDAKILPVAGGVALGLAYAAAWLAAADRDGRRGNVTSASFHAVVVCLVAYPLLWEAIVRFAVVGSGSSAVALSGATLAILGVAVHSGTQATAWIATLLAIPTTIALIGATGAAVPYATSLIAVGVTTLWIGYTWDWIWLRWPWAAAADVVVFALAIRGANRNVHEPAGIVLAVQMFLLNAYLGSIVVRTIVRARDVIGFEIVQTIAALAVGFGGALYVVRTTGYSSAGGDVLALVNLVFGIGCYAAAFVFVRQRPRNFYFYCTLALMLIVVSARLLLAPNWLTLAFDALALAAMWSAVRIGSVALSAHAAVYVSAAAIASQLLSTSARALTAPEQSWTPFGWSSLVTIAAMVACWAWPLPRRHELLSYQWTPRIVIVALLTLAAVAWSVSATAPLLARTTSAAGNPGAIATLRTAALAAAALVLGRVGRHEAFRESLWLLYPVLAVGAVKLLVEDFRRSPPAALFVALAVYGGALIAAPRLSRRRV